MSGSALMTSCIEQPPGRAATASNTAATIVDMDGRHYARPEADARKALTGRFTSDPAKEKGYGGSRALIWLVLLALAVGANRDLGTVIPAPRFASLTLS
jgi:hypothetical protein